MTTEQYQTLRTLAIDRGRSRMVAVQPELGRDYCYHLCHNCGTPAARAELARANKLAHYISSRSDREFRLREHRQHVQPVWWCDQCQGRKARYRA